MGWNTSARTIKGITYSTGTAFVLNGNVPCYNCSDASTPKYWKNSVTAWYYGYFWESYTKHPYCMSTTRPGKPDLFVDESAFPPATYYVYYKLNNGSGNFTTQSKVYDGSVTLHKHSPSRSGYTFLGWSTSSSATQATYPAGNTNVYKGNASITLYAVWSANTCTVTYDANGGAGAPSAQSFVYASDTRLSTKVPSREGYTFINWNYGNHYFSPGDKIPRDWGSFRLVAQWNINRYRLTADANGGSFVSGTDAFVTNADYGTVVNLPTAVRTGYTFAGWAVTGKGSLDSTGTRYTLKNSDVTLVAQWAINEYKLTLDANVNGGTPSKVVDYAYGELASSKSEALYTPIKKYCDFIGWYTVPEETEDEPVDLSTLVITKDTVLYARFEEKNTVLVSTEGANRPAMLALCPKDKFIEQCEVMIYVDGAWRKAVVQT